MWKERKQHGNDCLHMRDHSQYISVKIVVHVVHMDHIQTKYSRSSLCIHTCPPSACKAFIFSVESVVQKCNPSIQLLSSVMRNCRKIGLPICESSSHDSSNGLPTHNCHYGVSEMERLKWKLKDLRSMLTQH